MPVLRLLVSSLFTVFAIGCCKPRIHQAEGLSRTLFEIDLRACSSPFRAAGFVGGEHTDVYSLHLASGSPYHVVVTSEQCNADSGFLLGDDPLAPLSVTDVEGCSGAYAAGRTTTYVVTARDGLECTLLVFAHPSDHYTVRFSRVKGAADHTSGLGIGHRRGSS